MRIVRLSWILQNSVFSSGFYVNASGPKCSSTYTWKGGLNLIRKSTQYNIEVNDFHDDFYRFNELESKCTIDLRVFENDFLSITDLKVVA